MISTIQNDAKLNSLRAYINSHKEMTRNDSLLIRVLQKAQEIIGYLPPEIMNFIAQEMSIPRAQVWGVATFYHYFFLKPVGKYIISVCMGTACYLKGAEKILKAFKEKLNINIGETTDDKLFTLIEARCLGACGLAPAVSINGTIYGQLDEKKAYNIIKKYINQSK
ncbi:MAG: NADH-quinone oxidoreductase subunit NuoE [Spirochaetales bacterium]|nr:NADH-quinone oxidoreductase subunit NuoE [Spirochaetales bacterium]